MLEVPTRLQWMWLGSEVTCHLHCYCEAWGCLHPIDLRNEEIINWNLWENVSKDSRAPHRLQTLFRAPLCTKEDENCNGILDQPRMPLNRECHIVGFLPCSRFLPEISSRECSGYLEWFFPALVWAFSKHGNRMKSYGKNRGEMYLLSMETSRNSLHYNISMGQKEERYDFLGHFLPQNAF